MKIERMKIVEACIALKDKAVETASVEMDRLAAGMDPTFQDGRMVTISKKAFAGGYVKALTDLLTALTPEDKPPVSMEMWVLYDHPKDFPKHFVARKWSVMGGELQPTNQVIASEDADQIRKVLRDNGLARVEESGQKDPKIMETWL